MSWFEPLTTSSYQVKTILIVGIGSIAIVTLTLGFFMTTHPLKVELEGYAENRSEFHLKREGTWGIDKITAYKPSERDEDNPFSWEGSFVYDGELAHDLFQKRKELEAQLFNRFKFPQLYKDLHQFD